MRPRIPRPNPPPELRVPEDDIPTRTDRPPHSTFRPPSKHNIELSESDRLLGELMASQARLESAWTSRALEYETFKQTVGHIHRDVREMHEELKELKEAQHKTGKTIGNTAKLAPALIALIEIIRALMAHYTGG